MRFPVLMKLMLDLAHSLGLVGVFGLTLFDGSLLWLLPGINDIVLIGFVIAKGTWGWALGGVVAATAGSMIGAFTSYRIGHRGGGEMFRKRCPPVLLNHIENWTNRLGAVPVGVAALLPPPFPYAPFVFSAGVMKVPRRHFGLSVGIGRGLRYALEAELALVFGRRMLTHPHAFYRAALRDYVAPAGGAFVVILLGWLVYRRLRPNPNLPV